MPARRTIFHNVLSTSAGQFIALILGVVTHAFWARAIGPEQYGILGLAVTIVSYFGLAAVLGTDVWGARSVARNAGDARQLPQRLRTHSQRKPREAYKFRASTSVKAGS